MMHAKLLNLPDAMSEKEPKGFHAATFQDIQGVMPRTNFPTACFEGLVELRVRKALDDMPSTPVVKDGLTSLTTAVIPVFVELIRTIEKKQQDYGPNNLIKFDTFGVLVRMNDKWERLLNLTEEGTRLVGDQAINSNNESVEDTLLDLANYAVIMYVMHKKLWPVQPVKKEAAS